MSMISSPRTSAGPVPKVMRNTAPRTAVSRNVAVMTKAASRGGTSLDF